MREIGDLFWVPAFGSKEKKKNIIFLREMREIEGRGNQMGGFLPIGEREGGGQLWYQMGGMFCRCHDNYQPNATSIMSCKT